MQVLLTGSASNGSGEGWKLCTYKAAVSGFAIGEGL